MEALHLSTDAEAEEISINRVVFRVVPSDVPGQIVVEWTFFAGNESSVIMTPLPHDDVRQLCVTLLIAIGDINAL